MSDWGIRLSLIAFVACDIVEMEALRFDESIRDCAIRISLIAFAAYDIDEMEALHLEDSI